MSGADYFEVEKVLGKRVRRGRVQYRIQWNFFSKVHAKWVGENDCRCAIKIKDFEIERLDNIIGRQNIFKFILI